MIVPMLLGLQAATLAGPPAPLPAPVPAPLPAPVRIVRLCPPPTQEGDEVTVCARPGAIDRYRLKPLPGTAAAAALPKAETRIFGNAKLSAETEAANVGGFVSNRVMVRLKLPF